MTLSTRCDKQDGLSLIELLVSMSIGLFLIGGLVGVYLSTKQADRIRTEVTLMEENARIALSSINQIISHAGYPSMRHFYMDTPFHAEDKAIDNPSCRGAHETLVNLRDNGSKGILTKKTGRIGTNRGAKRDGLVTISIADSPNDVMIGKLTKDCMRGEIPLECSSDKQYGMYTPADAKLYSYLHIDTREGKRALRCTGSRGGTQPLADNIENMQFLFGMIDKNSNYQYRNAEEVTINAQWNDVVSVQVAILVRSEKEVLAEALSKTFILLDEEITIPKDRRLYRVYTTSIVLLNRTKQRL